MRDFRSCMGRLSPINSSKTPGFVGQALLLDLEHRFAAGTNERDREDVGQRNRDVEIGLAEAALFEVDVDRAERVRLRGPAGTQIASA